MIVELTVAVIGSSVLSTLITWLTTRRKNSADATKILVDAALGVLTPYRDLPKEVQTLREENHKLQLSNERLEGVVEELRRQLHAERELSEVREREFNASIRTLMERLSSVPPASDPR